MEDGSQPKRKRIWLCLYSQPRQSAEKPCQSAENIQEPCQSAESKLGQTTATIQEEIKFEQITETIQEKNELGQRAEINKEEDEQRQRTEADQEESKLRQTTEINQEENEPTQSPQTNLEEKTNQEPTRSPDRNLEEKEPTQSTERNQEENKPTQSPETNTEEEKESTRCTERNQEENKPTQSADNIREPCQSEETNQAENKLRQITETIKKENELGQSAKTIQKESKLGQTTAKIQEKNELGQSAERNKEEDEQRQRTEADQEESELRQSTELNQEENDPTQITETIQDKNEPTQSTEVNQEENEPTQSPETNQEENKPTQSPETNLEENKPTQSPETNLEENKPTQSTERNLEEKEPTQSPERNQEEKEPTQSTERYQDLGVEQPQITVAECLVFPLAELVKSPAQRLEPSKLPAELSILAPCCMNPRLLEQLYDDGFLNITNVDSSTETVTNMLEMKGRERPEMKWRVMNFTAMQFPDEVFDAVVDKRLDDLMKSRDGEIISNIYLYEVKRILKGKYICITSAKSHVLDLLLPEFRFGWEMSLHSIAAEDLQTFVVVAEKSDPDIAYTISLNLGACHGDQADDVITAVEKENNIRGAYSKDRRNTRYTLEDLKLGARGKISEFEPGRRINLILGLSRGKKSFIYNCVLLDAKQGSGRIIHHYALYVVPQLRARDEKCTSKKGQWRIIESLKAARLLMVFLDSSNSIYSTRDIYHDLAPYMKQLAPGYVDCGFQVASDGIKDQEIP